MLFFVPESPVHQTIVLVLIFAITGTGVALLAPHPPSFHAFLLPTVLPVMSRNAWEGDTPHLAVAFIVFVMTLSIIGVSRRSHAMIVESLRNRYRNLELVSRLQQQNDELDHARQVAEQASRAKTQFFAAASHDLRQPLHAMGLFAAALSEKVRDPEVVHVVHSINASVDALEALFTELLDISKIDAGVIQPTLSDCSVQLILDRIALDYEPEASERGLRLVIRRCGDFVFSDPVLLERILRNLVANALRYTNEGGVLLGCRRRGRFVRLEVWDTGVGIPEDQRERIFEEFYQLGNPARSTKKGMGLGLSIVQRLCRLLGYELAVSSWVGRGSVFRFEVPRGNRERGRPACAPAGSQRALDLNGINVLVIDDEEQVLAGMRVLLEGWGARVFAGPGTSEALTAIAGAAARPDLVITDLHLQHGVSGFDVIRDLRRRFGSDTPAILISGSVAPEYAESARTENLHFLLKPVNPAKLRALIHFKLNRQPLHAERGG